MALHIRELCKRLKSKQGFVLVYALIALVLSMLVITLLVISTTSYYKKTNEKIGNTGALASVQSGIDIMEYRINELLPTWFDCTNMEDVGINNIEELRQKLQSKIVDIPMIGEDGEENRIKRANGTYTNVYLLMQADINTREVEGENIRDRVSGGVKIYVDKDELTINSNGELKVLIVGSYIVNSEIYYKVATVTLMIEEDEVDNTDIIRGIKLVVKEFKEGIEGGTDKWGQVQ